ncbi:MAG TPA: DUF3800 domain-containing protein [Candidatus Angelobacter sp.]
MPEKDFALLKSEYLGTPLELVCQYLFQRIITLTRQRYGDSERIALAFDMEPFPDGEEYLKIYHEYATRHQHADTLAYRSLNFASREDFPPLQAADILAYTTYQWEMANYYPKEAPHYFPIIPAFLRMIEGIEPDGGRYNLAGLRKLIANVRAAKKMPLNPNIQEKTALCSNPNCGKSFVVTYDTRHPNPGSILRVPCPHCDEWNDVSWP